MPIVGVIKLISPSLVEYLQVNAITGIQVYSQVFKYISSSFLLIVQSWFEFASRQLCNLDMRLYQSVSLDYNYCSQATTNRLKTSVAFLN